jgi:hypothetical protein
MGLKFRRGTNAQKSGSLAFGEPYVNTDLGTLQIGGATGDITLGASGTGSQGSFAGISGSSLDITGNAKIDGNLSLGGNITIGDNTSDTVNVTAALSSSLIPSVTNAFDLGSATKIWRDLYISTGSIKIINPGTGQVVGTITSNANGDVNTGTQNVSGSLNMSGSIIPGATNTFDLGSPTKQFRHLYVSTGSIYMNGVAILSSNATDLTLTTDVGQSLKLLETASDTITLQTAEGNLTLTSTGAGDVILDPATGVVSIKGTLQVQDGNKITSSGGNTVQFGNNVAITGSLITTTGLTVGGNLTVNGTTTTIDSTNINIGDNIIVLNGTLTTNGGIYVKDAAGGNTATGSLLWDTTNDKWIAGPLGSELGILRTGGDSVVSGSSQITYASISSIPAGIVSGSSQTIANLPTGTVSGSSQISHDSTTGYSANKHVDHTSVLISAGNGLSGGGDISSTRTLALDVTSSTFTTGVKSKLDADGVISSSAQLTSTFDTRYLNTGGDGVVSGSSQITYASISSIPGGIVSGSSQIAFSGVTGTVSNAQLANSTISGKALGANLDTLTIGTGLSGTSYNGSSAVTIANSGVTSITGTANQVIASAGTGGITLSLPQSIHSAATPTFGNLTISGTITATGDITAFFTSDIRHKNNVQLIDNALEKVNALNGVTWEWNDDVDEVTKTTPKTGLIAQDVLDVLPEVVKTRENGFLALDYSKMVGLLVEAIKEQDIVIQKLKSDMVGLSTTITVFEDRMKEKGLL